MLYSTHEPCAMCAGACVWCRIGAMIYGVSRGRYFRVWPQARTTPRTQVAGLPRPLEKGNHRNPIIGGFLRRECQKLFSYGASKRSTETGRWR